jgi:hypothetical protein
MRVETKRLRPVSDPTPELLAEANLKLDRLESAAARADRQTCYELLDEIRDMIAANPALLMLRRISMWYESKGTQVLLNSWHLDRQRRTIQALN